MTGMEIFERAMDLCALRSANDTFPEDVGDLHARALGLLNLLMGELRPLEERLTGRKQPIKQVYSLQETIDMHHGICSSLLPYALAAMLISEEDRDLYAVFAAKVQEARRALLSDGAARRHGIVEVYG